MINIKSLLLLSELQLESSPTKSQSDYMYGLYYLRSAYLSYSIRLSICPNICMCIAFPFTSTLGSGEMFVYIDLSQTYFSLQISKCMKPH